MGYNFRRLAHKRVEREEEKKTIGDWATPTRKLWFYFLPRWQMVRAGVEMRRVVFETQGDD